MVIITPLPWAAIPGINSAKEEGKSTASGAGSQASEPLEFCSSQSPQKHLPQSVLPKQAGFRSSAVGEFHRHCRQGLIPTAFQRLGNQRHPPTMPERGHSRLAADCGHQGLQFLTCTLSLRQRRAFRSGHQINGRFPARRTGRVPYCRTIRVAIAVHSRDPGTKSHRHWSR